MRKAKEKNKPLLSLAAAGLAVAFLDVGILVVRYGDCRAGTRNAGKICC